MAVQGQKKEFALDSNILFDLAAEKDFAHAFREGYQERGYSLRVPPHCYSGVDLLCGRKKVRGDTAGD
jgi:hypothetical protein